MVKAVRGATTIDEGSDEGSEMISSMSELFDALSYANKFRSSKVISVFFTQTNDLTAMNAAMALREARPEFSCVPLFCSSEPYVEGRLPRTVRVLVSWRGFRRRIVPVYLKDARVLRPDLAGNLFTRRSMDLHSSMLDKS